MASRKDLEEQLAGYRAAVPRWQELAERNAYEPAKWHGGPRKTPWMIVRKDTHSEAEGMRSAPVRLWATKAEAQAAIDGPLFGYIMQNISYYIRSCLTEIARIEGLLAKLDAKKVKINPKKLPKRKHNPSIRDYATNEQEALQAAQDIDKWGGGFPATAHVRLLAKAAKMPRGGDPGFWAGELYEALTRASGYNPKVVGYIGKLAG